MIGCGVFKGPCPFFTEYFKDRDSGRGYPVWTMTSKERAKACTLVCGGDGCPINERVFRSALFDIPERMEFSGEWCAVRTQMDEALNKFQDSRIKVKVTIEGVTNDL